MRKLAYIWAIAIYLICTPLTSRASDNLTSKTDPTMPDISFAQESALPSEAMLTLTQAREYMLSLINRDRATAHCAPVKLDPTACAAGQLHSDTMANVHFNSHWHPDGKKPPQRYCEIGGFDYVMENSHGTGECSPFVISVPEKQLFTKKEIEDEESCYFDEKPPNDGHRKNMLDPDHTHVGLGVTLIELKVKSDLDGQEDTDRQLVSSQEFINKRAGDFTQSDTSLRKGKTYILSGQLDPNATFYSFGLAWEEAAKPIPLVVLKDESKSEYHGSYTLPAKEVLAAFPLPYTQTDNAKASVEGKKFSCQITPVSDWRSGLYYITIWAQIDGAAEPQAISLHTITLE